jgi:BirA family biotin operon repressor/biotin-[acetyl-CoA-carboxylase] ligase
MQSLPIAWGLHDLWQQLHPLIPGLTIEVVSQTDSTNTRLLERVHTDASPCLLIAQHQTAGRGQQGREWQSRPQESLTFSLAMPFSPRNWLGLSLAVGLALIESLDPHQVFPAFGLKWPNDICLVADQTDFALRKMGGILIETCALRGAMRWMVMGVGLNIHWAPSSGLSSGWSKDYAALGDILPELNVIEVLHRTLPHLVQMLVQFEQAGFAPLQARFNARHLLQGRFLQVKTSAIIAGKVHSVDERGALIVQTHQGPVPVHSGSVQWPTLPAGIT